MYRFSCPPNSSHSQYDFISCIFIVYWVWADGSAGGETGGHWVCRNRPVALHSQPGVYPYCPNHIAEFKRQGNLPAWWDTSVMPGLEERR